MTKLFAVAAGGAFGASLRYLFTMLSVRIFGLSFPWGTFGVNIIGSFIMGLVVMIFALRFSSPPALQSFLVTGMLGGFTTFSAFSLDAYNLFERSGFIIAFAYVLATVAMAIIALIAGIMSGRVLLS